MTRARGLVVAWGVALAAVSALTVVWLALGAVVALAVHVPPIGVAVGAAAAGGGAWADGIVAGAELTEPAGQAALDYAATAVNLVVAVVLWRRGGRSWTVRLLVLAMVGSAGAFNLQAHAATAVVRAGTGLEIGELHQILLHGVASAAYAGALLLFPGDETGTGRRRQLLIALGAVVLFVAGMGTALLPHTVSCVIFFGFVVPLVGMVGVSRHLRHGATPERRAQARLLITVLAGALGTAAVLAVLTLVLAALGTPGLTLDDPTARHGGSGGGEPTALLFWFTRVAAAALALAVLAAFRPRRQETDGGLHRALAVTIVVVLLGGAYVLVAALLGAATGSALAANAVATVLTAGAFLPLSARVDLAVERLLYGRRPTPYSVLLEVAELSRTPDGTDLEHVAEAVGRRLGARSVRLTVHRPGLRDRTYTWAPAGAGQGDVGVPFPISYRGREVGVLTVDAEALAGRGDDRRRLMADVTDSLGAVLQSHRLEIELERQLRAAVAHGEEIAESRRQAVAEMDGERRSIERNLHDGAQHHLVSLRLTLGLVEHQISAGELDAARERLGLLVGQIDTAEAVLAETATGVSSATLVERGLVESLRHDLAGGSTDPAAIGVDAEGIAPGRRYDAEVESAVYFCCLEAVNNARKHAPGAPLAVTLQEASGMLRFVVRDGGPGFTPDPGPGAGGGRGVRNVTVRIAAVGGGVAVRSAPGAGTTVEGYVPVTPAPPATPDTSSPADRDLDDPTPTAPVPITPMSGSAATTSLMAVPAPVAGPHPSGSALFDDVLDLLDRVGADTPAAATEGLAAITGRARRPWRVGVEGPAEAADSARVRARGLPGVELVDPATEAADALLVIGDGVPDRSRTVPAVAVPDPGDAVPAIVGRCLPRAGTVRAQRALDDLDGLARGAGRGPWRAHVQYEVERLRAAGAREVAESGLVDALARGEVGLRDEERRAAERLIGREGTEPWARLGLDRDASPADVRHAAEEALAGWQRRAAHPASTRTVRDAAGLLARVCEALLVDPDRTGAALATGAVADPAR